MGTALLVLILILILFGAGGVVMNFLWYFLIGALILWALGFVVRTADGGGRWYRW
jgi:hypothetical protein